MPKKIPTCPPKPTPALDTGRSYEIELITPMFGGGTTAGKVDCDFPIRPTAIRGQLQFWWRATVGAQYATRQELRAAQSKVWGDTKRASRVQVRVEVLTADPPAPCARFERDKNDNSRFRSMPIWNAPFNKTSLPYALFPFQGQLANGRRQIEIAPALCIHTAKFRLTLLCHKEIDFANEVEPAIWAWVNFGGLGNRTRRGCGAIHCQSLVATSPKLPARIFVGATQTSAIDAWIQSLEAYRDFRQTPRGRRHQKTIHTRKGPKTIWVPGRSHWPEADSIRLITGCSLKPLQRTPPSGVPADEDPRDHSTPVVPENMLPAFPKAVLGLPINFHFADGPNKENAAANRDPKDVQLYPMLPAGDGRMEKAERMASPIITRPLWINGKWRPAIIILEQRLPEGMQVRLEGRNASLSGNLSHDVPWNRVVDPSLGAITPMRGKATAIDALIDFLDSRNFTEVTR